MPAEGGDSKGADELERIGHFTIQQTEAPHDFGLFLNWRHRELHHNEAHLGQMSDIRCNPGLAFEATRSHVVPKHYQRELGGKVSM